MQIPTETERLREAMEARERRFIAARGVPKLRLKRKRKGKKKHSVNKERSFEDRTKAASMTEHQADYNKMRQQYNAAMRLYWSGGAPDIRTAERMAK
jgi:hypothetical protein